jgi:PIN domain nuclease of toxin-antitoxin system
VRLLLDTHVLLWWRLQEPLAPPAADAIADPRNDVFVSAASIWEAEIKAAAGKLRLGVDLVEQVSDARFRGLPIELQHGVAAARLPPHHRDPFDRMLIAQAKAEGLTLVSRDPVFGAYGIPLLAA